MEEDFVPKPAAKPLTPIFFLIDTSGSMNGQKIDAVNNAMQEAIPAIQEFAENNSDSNIRVNVLEFNSAANWRSNGLSNVEDLIWVNLQATGGTSLGSAYSMLSEKLSRKNGGFLQEHVNNKPIIILLTDGYPTDDAASGLNLLKQNKWFQNAIRIAFELEGGVDHQALVDFTGSEEFVIPVSTDRLKEHLKVVAINSAMIGSKSQTMTQRDAAQNIIKPMVDPNKEITPNLEPTPEPAPTPNPPSNPEDDPFNKFSE